MSVHWKDVGQPLLDRMRKASNISQVHFALPTFNTGGSGTSADLDDETKHSPHKYEPRKRSIFGIRRADTDMSWGMPLGLGVRSQTDEALVIFRKALGINWSKGSSDGAMLEEGRKSATGIYKAVIDAQKTKHVQYSLLTVFLFALYFSQVVIGAALTSFGPSAADYTLQVTILGAVNTIVAGALALVKGSGQPQRLGKDQVGYQRLQDWIEETEALLTVGVIGRDSREVGLLVEVAFKKYNAAKASEVNNRPDFYVTQTEDQSSSKSDVGNKDDFKHGS